MMDHVLLETIITNQIKSYRGHEFQDFGDRLLRKLYPAEYTPVRAGGPWGDLKNDGYCFVNRTFFHFYGTSQHNVSALKAKITSDIEGCLEKQQQVKKIVYVTNDSSLGVIESHIDGLRIKHAIDIETWGPAKLVDIMQTLSLRDVGSVLKLSLTNAVTTTGPTNITYSVDESSIEIIDNKKKHLKSNIIISTATVAVGIVLYFLLHWFFFAIVAFFLVIIIARLPWEITKTLKADSNGEFQHEKDFYAVDGNNRKRYRKKALCSYPQCTGVVYLDVPPERLKKQYKAIGYCSSDPTHHTFTYDAGTGKPVTIYTGNDQYASDTDRIIADVIRTDGKLAATKKYVDLTGHTLERSKAAVDGIANKYAVPDGGNDWGCGCAIMLLFLALLIYICW